jgi:hypothetical protein
MEHMGCWWFQLSNNKEANEGTNQKTNEGTN